MIDILIRNGLIADGTGNPAYTADLAIEGDRIAGIGRFSGAQAAVTIDAIGKVVCPGFIDVHLHSEVEMLAGRATAGVQMGVTTELICPDGITFTSIPRRLFDDYYRYIFGIYGPVDVTWDCESISSYLAQFKGRIRNNIACKVPHGVVRLAVKGWQTGPATDDELKAMGRIVRDWMEAGAVAFDTGLGYAPASYSDLRELVYLSKIVAGYGGVYTAHMRNYGPERAASIAETVAIARQAEIPVNIDHFGGTPEIYAEANAARAAGVDITWDAYPYMAGCTLMSYALPTELFRRGAGAVLAALGQRDQRRQLESTLETWFPSNASPFFAYVTLPANKWMEGMRVREVWRQSGKSFVDFYCDLLLEENLAPLLIYPWALIVV